MKYKTKKGLIKAIRKLESTEPKRKIKGYGHDRRESVHVPMLAAICRKQISEGRHFVTVFARRSKRARYNNMQFGPDTDYISPEMDRLIEKNAEMIESLADAYKGYLSWVENTTI
jgi:hypothetical protein